MAASQMKLTSLLFVVTMVTYSCSGLSLSRRMLLSPDDVHQLTFDPATNHFAPGHGKLQDWAREFGREYRSASLDGGQESSLGQVPSFGPHDLQDWNSFYSSQPRHHYARRSVRRR